MRSEKSSALMPEEEGRARILAALKPIETVEELSLLQARGRVLARQVVARRTQPPADMSAMDGYAVRAQDVQAAGARLRLIGESAAGHPFAGTVGVGETVRIFTGAEVPEGANAILIQENTQRDGKTVVATAPVETGRHIRRRGNDFRAKEIVLEAGIRLAPRHLALAAAADHGALAVTARPRVALFATGDELVAAGSQSLDPARAASTIVDSNGPALAALIEAAGGRLVHRGRLKDTPEAIGKIAKSAAEADLVITIGGVSVGDRDLVRARLPEHGFETNFWKLAIRPGKPLMFGHLDGVPLIGLPGNPVSALLTAQLFVVPALLRLQGMPGDALEPPLQPARLAAALPENGTRKSWLRATIERHGEGMPVARPLAGQDSAQLSSLAAADAFIVRPANAPAAEAGTIIDTLPLDPLPTI